MPSRHLRDLPSTIRSAPPPAGVQTQIVAVDGAGGAGKSSFARWLAQRLGEAPVIHTDDFASWDNPIDWWPRLLPLVLQPLAAGKPARYHPTAWGEHERQLIEIEPGGTVILEGVTSSRKAFQPFLAYSIWIETPRDERLKRGLARDGTDARAQWEQWMEAEDRYIEDEHPDRRADMILRGDDGSWTNRLGSAADEDSAFRNDP